MKNHRLNRLVLSLMLGGFAAFSAAAQQDDDPPPAPPTDEREVQPVVEDLPEPPGDIPPVGDTDVPPVVDAPPPERPRVFRVPGREQFRAANAEAASSAPAVPSGDATLRLNFRNAPLELVLNYLSEAAGFIIVLDTEVRGRMDVWSNQPVTQQEALAILDGALAKNGYAALRSGRTLTIVSRDTAKRRDIPVIKGNNPAEIPRSDEIVTQVIPVNYITAAQLTQNLESLLPAGAEMTANEAGNALIITATQAGIRRMTEIVRALDSSSAGNNSLRVFALRYADAKELATVIKELFSAETVSSTSNGRSGNGGGGGGGPGGGFPGFGGPGGNGGGNNNNNNATTARAAASRVTAVADEHSNSIIVNAPEDVLPEIEQLIASVDTNVQDVTELRVFRLKNADPGEMAELLSGLFPDEAETQPSGRQVQFGGGPPGGFQGGQSTAGTASDREKKKGKVIAVADRRTSSVVVSAAHELMGQIEAMVQQLDTDPARKQKVFVYNLDNADPTQVEQVLRSLFENQNTMNRNQLNNRNSQQNSALNNRQTQNQNFNRSTTGSGTGTGGSFGQTQRR
ncbi:MAG: hypothetical protein KIT22_05315 [Verrucomicrobiae bacterium]|nr:hypothetical protein [Verrucomicrobiae bacterium]